MNSLSPAEQAALPHVTIVALFKDEPETTLTIYPRRILDLITERLGATDGHRMVCGACDSVAFSLLYDSKHGLVIPVCRSCKATLGGVRVAADA